MNKIFLLILLSIILVACRSKNLVTLTVVQPARINMPSYIKKVGIINWSAASQENEKIDQIEKILSLEGKNMDKEGADKSVQAVLYELQKNNSFTEVKIIDGGNLKTSGVGVMPSTLPWVEVQKIGKDNNVDALYSLEMYDTDTKVNYTTQPVTLNGPLGVTLPSIEHIANLNTYIKTAWRIYDVSNKNILDEAPYSATVTSSGRGINPLIAVQAALGRKEAVMDRSNKMGQAYAMDILPYEIRVSRDYYVRGTNNFKIAKRKAQTGNWNEAGELWKKETTHIKTKVAGRACYNMAIISEINGNRSYTMGTKSL